MKNVLTQYEKTYSMFRFLPFFNVLLHKKKKTILDDQFVEQTNENKYFSFSSDILDNDKVYVDENSFLF